MKIVNRRIIEAVKGLGLPEGEYAVFGSGLMEVLGIRDSGDVDLIVTKRLFDELVEREDWERFVYENNGDEAVKYRGDFVDVAFWDCKYFPGCDEEGILGMIGRVEVIDGVSFVNLEDMISWKSGSEREKDRRDVELIRDFIERERQNG